jgi:hypothetical protein
MLGCLLQRALVRQRSSRDAPESGRTVLTLNSSARDPKATFCSVQSQTRQGKLLGLSAQLSEELPHICHHRLGLLPEREMASTRHLSVVNQIEISLQCASWRIEERHFMRRGGKTGWNSDSTIKGPGIFFKSPIKPGRCTDGVSYKINHRIRDHLLFRENRLSCRRIAPSFEFFDNPRCYANWAIAER